MSQPSSQAEPPKNQPAEHRGAVLRMRVSGNLWTGPWGSHPSGGWRKLVCVIASEFLFLVSSTVRPLPGSQNNLTHCRVSNYAKPATLINQRRNQHAMYVIVTMTCHKINNDNGDSFHYSRKQGSNYPVGYLPLLHLSLCNTIFFISSFLLFTSNYSKIMEY